MLKGILVLGEEPEGECLKPACSVRVKRKITVVIAGPLGPGSSQLFLPQRTMSCFSHLHF